jgi:S-adenosylmethionine-diacylgycerolhomoserine-N-methlytransferase
MTPADQDFCRSRQAAIQRYYRIHARIYDLTRWTFLRGRKILLKSLAAGLNPHRILEVGCGTGTNLLNLAHRFPLAQLWGLDLSADMMAMARRKLKNFSPRLTLVQAAYDQPLALCSGFDLIVFSYALSMFNPGWKEAVDAAIADLNPGGALAIVDFHETSCKNFKQWMGKNHVCLDGHLLPHLRAQFDSYQWDVRPVYGGLWSYFLFLGQNPRQRY